jgi:ABC-type amino acid transport substrate-binding protein
MNVYKKHLSQLLKLHANSRLLSLFILFFILLLSTSIVSGIETIESTYSEKVYEKITLTEEEKVWLKKHPVLRIANEDDWPPFDFSIEGKAQGISMDYIKLIAARLGIELEFINGFSWDELQNKAKNKELEVLINL